MSKIVTLLALPTRRMRSSGYSALDEDSGIIASKVEWALTQNGYQVEQLAVDEDTIGLIGKIEADCVFNLCEWSGKDRPQAEKAFAQLRNLDIPVTGATERSYFLSDNKVEMKRGLGEEGLAIPRGQTLVTGREELNDLLPYPVIIKPSLEHCSVGLTRESIAHDEQEARAITLKQIAKFDQPVIAEEYVAGRELLAYLIQVQDEVHVLPIEEVKFASFDPMAFQTYESKWVEGHHDYNGVTVELAELTKKEQQTIEEVCRRAFAVMEQRGYSRIDLRLRGGVPIILEVNANPSVYDDEEREMQPEMEVIYGIKFVDYIKAIVESAFYHYQKEWEI